MDLCMLEASFRTEKGSLELSIPRIYHPVLYLPVKWEEEAVMWPRVAVYCSSAVLE